MFKFLCVIFGHTYSWDALYDNHLCNRCGFDRTHGERDRMLQALCDWNPYQEMQRQKKPQLTLVVNNTK